MSGASASRLSESGSLPLGEARVSPVRVEIISHAIDAYTQQTFVLQSVALQFLVVAVLVFSLTYLQSVVQTYASERVARDLRTRVAARISTQTYADIERITPAKLLTNLTSDVDAVKLFVSMAIATIISSVFLIVGSGTLLLLINWRLGLCVLGIVPFIAITFQMALRKVRPMASAAIRQRLIAETRRWAMRDLRPPAPGLKNFMSVGPFLVFARIHSECLFLRRELRRER
jgi:ABC-type multidrug transport system fused ATPase/permease subunit